MKEKEVFCIDPWGLGFLVDLHLAGELDQRDMAAMMQHVEICEFCRATLVRNDLLQAAMLSWDNATVPAALATPSATPVWREKLWDGFKDYAGGIGFIALVIFCFYMYS